MQYGIPIVVDDGSSDKTGLIARNCGAHLVTHKKNTGYDGALNSGFSYAIKLNPLYILTIDADFQHNPSLIKKFIDQMDNVTDVIVGVRDVSKRFGETLFSMYFMYKFNIKDPLCGLKAYKSSLYVAQGYFDSFSSVGTELLNFAALNNSVIKQVDIETTPRQDVSRFGGKFTANLKLIKALVRLILKN